MFLYDLRERHFIQGAFARGVYVQNPRDRITLPEIMRHPWVTMSGHFPLKSTKDLKGDESQERHSGLVNGRTFAEVGPTC